MTWLKPRWVGVLMLLSPCLAMGQAVDMHRSGLYVATESGATCSQATLASAISVAASRGNIPVWVSTVDRSKNPCTWNITSNMTPTVPLIIPDGARINVASGITLTLNACPAAGDYQIFEGSGTVAYTGCGIANVRHFGADPTQTSDSSPAIQKACNAIEARAVTVGGSVYIPSGRYQIHTMVECGAHHLNFYGDGPASALVSYITAATPMIRLGDAAGGTLQGIEVHDLWFTGDKQVCFSGCASDAGAETCLLEMRNPLETEVYNNRIEFSGSDGLCMDGTEAARVFNNTIRNNTGDGIVKLGTDKIGAVNVYENNFIKDNMDVGLRLLTGGGHRVVHNGFEGHDFHPDAAAIYTSSPRVMVAHNTFEGNTHSAVVDRADDAVVVHFWFMNNEISGEDTLMLQDYSMAKIKNNVFFGGAGANLGANNNGELSLWIDNTIETANLVNNAPNNGEWQFIRHNDATNTALSAIFANGDTTPSVFGQYVFQAANTTPTSITAFDHMSIGQVIMVIAENANTTYVHNSDGPLLLPTAGNITPADGDVLVFIGRRAESPSFAVSAELLSWRRAAGHALPIECVTTENFDLTSVTVQTITFACSGADLSDVVTLGIPHAATGAGWDFDAWVSAANTVTLRAKRIDPAVGGNPASGLFRVRVYSK